MKTKFPLRTSYRNCLAGLHAVLATVLIGSTSIHGAEPGTAGIVETEFIYEQAPYPSCHASTIVETASGKLVAAWFGGTAERHPDVGIWVSRHEDGRWLEAVEVANGIQEDGSRLPTWNPVLFQAPGGDLHLFYKIGPSPSEWWGMTITSPDGGRTWTKPVRLPGKLIGAVKNKPIVLADGTWLAPSSSEADGWTVHVERSTDAGKTWKLIGPLNDGHKVRAIQPTLLTHADGRVQMLARGRNDKIVESFSSDGGLTWEPLTDGVLPNNNSGIDAVVLKDGRFLLVYNHSTREQPGMGHKGRGILNVAVSRDGKNWEAALVLEYLDQPNKHFAYPSVIQTADGLVHIVYTWHRQRIKHVVVDPSALETVPIKNGVWPKHVTGGLDIEWLPASAASPVQTPANLSAKPRIIVTSDGEIDDQCSMVRFLLYANEWDIEGIITSSSQYHWQGHNWAGDDWIEPFLDAYTQVYPNLVKHDPRYPTPEYLRRRTLLGNVKAEGDMEEVTAGSQLIVTALLDETDERPVWLQAWGGTNTIARALKTIEEEHPERMAEVAKKMRFFFIWEQDATYQDYIRPSWGKYEIPTIISDQFEAIAYRWDEVLPKEMQKYFVGAWMKENLLENHGPLCALYEAKENGDFRSEGDSPAFLHTIVTGLRNMESPNWGGWGGRYVRVRENTWLDPVPVEKYSYPKGRWYTNSAWGRNSLREGTTTTAEQRREYFKPMWRWADVLQKDFALAADWCVKSYDEANHPPVVTLGHAADLDARPGAKVELSARGATDPDEDDLKYVWWQYREAGSYDGAIEIWDAEKQDASFTVPSDAGQGKTVHVICEVSDTGSPPLTRYQRVVVEIE